MELSLKTKLYLGSALVVVSGTSVAVAALVVTGSGLLTILTLGATVVTAGVLGISARRLVQLVDALVADMEAIADGDLDRNITTTRTDELGDMFRSLESMRADLTHRIDDAEQARQEAKAKQQRAEDAEAELEAEIRTQQEEFEEYARRYSTLMADCAAGNLSCRLPTDSDSDAMAEIAMSFNDMMADIEATVADITAFTTRLQAANANILDEAEQLEAKSEEVSDSVADIAAGADEQDELIQQITEEMTALSSSFEEVAAQSEDVATNTQEAAETATQVQDAATDAANEIETIKTESAATIDQVRELTEEMDRVGEIVELIDDIAEQTNILALNASIEAARAGEAGEGFAVVADEVKQLAARTRDATDEIESVIDSVQSTTEQTATNMESMSEQVTRGYETIDDAVLRSTRHPRSRHQRRETSQRHGCACRCRRVA
jgi:methyl-accepting chemotaxis protein